MNMMLIKEENSDNRYVIKDENFKHITRHLKLSVGDSFTTGILHGKIGTSKIISIDEKSLVIDFTPTKDAPTPAKLKIIIAIPRPKVLKRVLKHLITFGIKDIILINSWSVEKSFMKSSLITEQKFDTYIFDGLEQAKDTIYPNIQVFDQFRPFVEDTLPQLSKDCEKLLAHPKNAVEAPYNIDKETIVAIGPDRGFNDFEVEKFEQLGFKTVTLGDRILHQESAIPYIIGRLL